MKNLLFVLLAVAAFASCELWPTVDVRYEVDATESVYLVTISADGTSQFSDVSLPWAYIFEAQPDDFVYVSAGGYGTVEVSIYLDGKLYKHTQSVGSPVIATASGTAQ